MITSADLAQIPLFAGVEETERQRLARKAADIHLVPGDWLAREGEEPRFFVTLEGEFEIVKNIVGQHRVLGRSVAQEFSGETPIFLGTANLVSVRAVTPARAARFERQQLQELVRDSPSAAEIIFSTMSTRIGMAQEVARATPSSRAYITGSKYDKNCRAIRNFLAANRIQYNWKPTFDQPDDSGHAPLTVDIDRTTLLTNPTVREVVEALGYKTIPKHTEYDVVIAGAGPAGMAAAVYGASEGLRVLMIERFAAGGQAGTSSRIENYLGFPSGISGDELTERALKQAKQFGAEIVVKRNIEALELTHRGYCVKLDGGDLIAARAILLATGVDWHRMDDVPGMAELQGRGILYGASRHEAYSVAGKRVFLVGGGNSAGQAAVFFSGYAAEVVILVRGAGLNLSMSQYLIDQIASKENIRVEPYTQVTAVEGENYLHRVITTARPPDGEETTQTRDSNTLFIMIGATANTHWLPAELERSPKGYICTGRDLTSWPLHEGPTPRVPFALETSLPGIFCAGDVRHNSIKRVASGVGEGSMAISFIHEYLALNETRAVTTTA
jgi:thioredoxin reductase (NADPH)